MALFSKRVKALQIRSGDELEAALSTGMPVFVDFWKPDCQPCRVMDGIVNELADEFQGEAMVLKANLQHVPDLFAKFKVRSTPTFLLVSRRDEGLHLRFRHSGLIKKDALVGLLEKAVATD